jgi:acyl-CoA thioesterase
MDKESQLKLAENTPFFGHLGIEVLDVTEGFARLRIDFGHHLTHPFGYYHGGVIATLADSAGINAVLTTLDGNQKALTLEMKINFLQAVRDEVVFAEGTVIHKGKRFAVSDVVVKSESGTLLAKAIVTCAIQ